MWNCEFLGARFLDAREREREREKERGVHGRKFLGGPCNEVHGNILVIDTSQQQDFLIFFFFRFLPLTPTRSVRFRCKFSRMRSVFLAWCLQNDNLLALSKPDVPVEFLILTILDRKFFLYLNNALAKIKISPVILEKEWKLILDGSATGNQGISI